MCNEEKIRVIGGIKMDKMRNDYDEYRKKLLNDITHKEYPKMGKINFELFKFMDLNVKYIEEEKVSSLPDYIKLKIDDDNNIIVLKDGNIIFSNLTDEFNKIKIKTYYDALRTNDDIVLKNYQDQFLINDDNKLAVINKIYQNSFLYIEIPKNFVLKTELKLYIFGESSDLVHRTSIVCHESSEFTLVEEVGNFNSIKVNYVSEVKVKENAKLNYIGIDRLENASAYIERTGEVSDDGKLVYALGELNDSNTVSNNIVKLLGKNSFCEFRSVLFTDKENIHAVNVHIKHLSPYSYGKILNHGIVKDKGYLYVDGIGKIYQGMNNSNSQQTTNIITLSDDAKVSVNPYLLIDEFDVSAGHGAGIGKVDEEQLYYLMSRGLSKRDAEKLIIIGFLYPIIEMIDSDNIKTSFVKTIENKLLI